MTDRRVEQVAEAIRQAGAIEEIREIPWVDLSGPIREHFRTMAKAAIAALGNNWVPTRWWHVTFVRDGKRTLWCETSDEAEARDHLGRVPSDVVDVRLERLWERHATEWREVQP